MKKILTLLTSLTLVGSSASIVSCSSVEHKNNNSDNGQNNDDNGKPNLVNPEEWKKEIDKNWDEINLTFQEVTSKLFNNKSFDINTVDQNLNNEFSDIKKKYNISKITFILDFQSNSSKNYKIKFTLSAFDLSGETIRYPNKDFIAEIVNFNLKDYENSKWQKIWNGDYVNPIGKNIKYLKWLRLNLENKNDVKDLEVFKESFLKAISVWYDDFLNDNGYPFMNNISETLQTKNELPKIDNNFEYYFNIKHDEDGFHFIDFSSSIKGKSNIKLLFNWK